MVIGQHNMHMQGSCAANSAALDGTQAVACLLEHEVLSCKKLHRSISTDEVLGTGLSPRLLVPVLKAPEAPQAPGPATVPQLQPSRD